MVEHDTEAGVTYARLTDRPVARTVEIDEVVTVDVDDRGEPVGVEFLAELSFDHFEKLFARFPSLREHFGELVVR